MAKKTKARKRGKKPVSLNLKRKQVVSPLESERDNPDNYPSLSHYLEKTGKIKLIPKTKMLKAKRLFVQHGRTPSEISEELDVDINVVHQWITLFDWTEKRDIILFRQFQNLEDLKRVKSKNIDYRHDRIAGSLETTIETMIHDHHDPGKEFTLAPKDLTALATALRSMQAVRRTVHDKPTSKSENKTEFLIDSGPGLDNLVRMVSNITGGKPLLEPPPVQIENVKDADFELVDDGNDREYEQD